MAFICKECLPVGMKWRADLLGSFGPCECCGKVNHCADWGGDWQPNSGTSDDAPGPLKASERNKAMMETDMPDSKKTTDKKDWSKPPPFVSPDSMWLVVYECRYDVIKVSPQGDGFFAPGQDAVWGFSNVTEWVREIKPPEDTNPDACPRCGLIVHDLSRHGKVIHDVGTCRGLECHSKH